MNYPEKREAVKKLIDVLGVELFGDSALAQFTEHQLDMFIALGLDMLGQTEAHILKEINK